MLLLLLLLLRCSDMSVLRAAVPETNSKKGADFFPNRSLNTRCLIKQRQVVRTQSLDGGF